MLDRHAAQQSAAAAHARAEAAEAALADSNMQALMEAFAASFLQPNVLAFFKAHKAALVGIFARYAGTEAALRPGEPGGGLAAAAEGRVSRGALSRFAADFALAPALMGDEELQQLATEVSRTAGQGQGGAEALTYAQFVELLGLAAFVLAAAQGNSAAPMLKKLQLMLLALEAAGAAFRGDPARAMLRAAAEAARQR